ncbi:MAG: ferredoxin [Clostridia bacterium]
MKIYKMYFSPTGTTEKIANEISGNIAKNFNEEVISCDFTLKLAREREYTFKKDDLLIIGVPTYAGRVPNVLLDFLTHNIKSNGALVLPFVLFGNRNYDESLMELLMILNTNGFVNVGAGAFVGEHSFSRKLGANRPDLADLLQAKELSGMVCDRILGGICENNIKIDENYKIKPYYTPRDRNGVGVNILKVKPKTNDKCDDCKICAKICPMGSISFENPREVIGICIKCGACEKKCPQNAKYYDDANYLYHKFELEEQFERRANNVIF